MQNTHATTATALKGIASSYRYGAINTSNGQLSLYGQLMATMATTQRSVMLAAITQGLNNGSLRPFQGSVLWVQAHNNCLPG